MLEHDSVRYHIKDLTLSYIFSLPDPSDIELDFVFPWIEKEIQARQAGKEAEDPFRHLLWQRFFYSSNWFQIVDAKGLINTWLHSEHKSLVLMGVNYLSAHRDEGDRIAELLMPFESVGGDWPEYFNNVMRWANLEDSQKLFMLFSRLLESGVLDDINGPVAVNANFWSTVYHVSEKHPEWLPRVISIWIKRALIIAKNKAGADETIDWFRFFNDDSGAKHVLDAARQAPREYLDSVLPSILELAQQAVYSDDQEPPIVDAIWGHPYLSEHPSLEGALITGVMEALSKMLVLDKPFFLKVIGDIQKSQLFVANHIILKVYTALAKGCANEAALLLCREPWRLHCGYSDSGYWISRELLTQIVPHCSPQNRTKLEQVIFKYSPEYERKAGSQKYRGHAEYTFLSAIPEGLRSQAAQKRFLELERKFKDPEQPPQESRMYTVGSPIKQVVAQKMTDAQWLKAMQVYDSEERKRDWEHPEKGGSWELAGALEERVKEEPERFSKFLMYATEEINDNYLTRWLDGLRQTELDTDAEIKYNACRKVFSLSPEKSGSAVADLIGSIHEGKIPSDIADILIWLATKHPEPQEELWSVEATGGKPYSGGKIYNHGINTTRGRAVEAIGRLIFQNKGNVEVFKKTLWQIAEDESFAVRSCLAYTLRAVANTDFPDALELFNTLTRPQNKQVAQLLNRRNSMGGFGVIFDKRLSIQLQKDDLLLATPQIDRFIYHNLHENADKLYPVLRRMINSTVPDVQDDGARLASIAELKQCKKARRLVRKGMRSGPFHRKGIAQVAAANLKYDEHSDWCIRKLEILFNDEDKDVRKTASHCFSKLHDIPLTPYRNLIEHFCESKSYAEGSSSFLRLLEQSSEKLPGVSIYACQLFLKKFLIEAKNIQSSRNLDSYSISKLAFRTYHQHPDDKWTSQCLDVIDDLCREDINSVYSGFSEFDR